MTEENRIVTFMGKAGKRRADISFDEWRSEPYVVEYYLEEEWVGHTCWKTEEQAEESAKAYTFKE
jgi:hypothetical protein